VRYAAIDCGTNAIRLLVADYDPQTGQLSEVCRAMRIVRLGEGVDRTRQFSGAALTRTFLACKLYQQALAELGDPPLVFAATSASRDVGNRDRFVAGVSAILGVVPEVVSGQREAQLSFLGATWQLPVDAVGSVLVFDIGGGSTELIRGQADTRQVAAAASVDLGCVRMTERHRDPSAPGGLAPALRTDVTALLAQANARVPLAGAATVIGLSGTVTTVAALALGLDSYDPALVHHARIPTGRVREVVEGLVRMTPAERAEVPAIHPGRLDVIVAGGIITETVFSWPGMGLTLLQAATTNDIPLIMGTWVFIGILSLTAHLVADIAYVFLDPRIRYT
jgi:exopolyphosphatase/guanosine-5'-triphosphate,3'-diphosphate pyrophosphatase